MHAQVRSGAWPFETLLLIEMLKVLRSQQTLGLVILLVLSLVDAWELTLPEAISEFLLIGINISFRNLSELKFEGDFFGLNCENTHRPLVVARRFICQE